MDFLTIAGIVVSVGSILVGQMLEGGHIGSILQLTAFMIVMGGTFGAILVQNPMPVVLKGFALLSLAILDPKKDVKALIGQIVDLANVSRKSGLLALEGKIKDLHDPFFRKGVQLIVDGTEPKIMEDILETEVEHHEEEAVNGAKIWEAAGGYAPTVGILGAVLGLIHVMENLADPSKLGGGIATAFVATIYGVGAANLLFLPIANKIKLKVKRQSMEQSVLIKGLVSLAQGENPRIIQEKLESYLPHGDRSHAQKG